MSQGARPKHAHVGTFYPAKAKLKVEIDIVKAGVPLRPVAVSLTPSWVEFQQGSGNKAPGRLDSSSRYGDCGRLLSRGSKEKGRGSPIFNRGKSG